ncbi:MAG TPA: rRNA adenine dimethyltransferase family protein, partial [Candidatus Absconditabacterales bacterium]|nr:rRNA adenine dimethyltransferase family protein [Candidatus Absconditabacterales bacterium]
MSTYLGQNFLSDDEIISYIASKIASLCQEKKSEAIFEIGPGKGAITREIHSISKDFWCFEKDETMKNHLKPLVGDKIIWGDILDLDIEHFIKEKNLSPEKIFIVGNLPYYITSPILRKFFSSSLSHFSGGFFMIQKEVGDKIKVDASKKSYLRRLLNFFYEVTYCKTVPPSAFSPAPKVHSCLISLTPKPTLGKFFTLVSYEKMLVFLDAFSPYKRKTLGKIQKMLSKSEEQPTYSI